MVPYTDGVSFTGFGSLGTGVNDRFVSTFRFQIIFLKACSAMCIASFSSNKRFGITIIAVTWGIFFLLIALAIYVFKTPIYKAYHPKENDSCANSTACTPLVLLSNTQGDAAEV
jgi:hypothetical protein